MKKIIIITFIIFIIIIFSLYLIWDKESKKNIDFKISESKIWFNKINFAWFVWYATSHSLWSIEDWDILLPFYAYYKDWWIYINRVESDYNEKSVEYLREIFKANINNYEYSLISYDWYFTIKKPNSWKLLIKTENWTKEIKYWKKDSIYIEAKNNKKNIIIALPYNPANSTKWFIIYKPKIIELNNIDSEKFLKYFYSKWIYSHNMFWYLYNKYLDESE